jgi:hypothetical protein
MPISDLAAGGVIHGPQEVEQLFAGEAPITTGHSFASDTVVKYQVCVLTAAGLSTNFTGVTSGEKCVIAAQAGIEGQSVPYYSGGCFNHSVLTWPSAQDNLAKRKLFFMGTPITIGELAFGGEYTPMA